jgi:hypothetical protein
MCLRVSYKKKYEKKLIFCILQLLKKGVGSGSISQRYGIHGSGSTPKCQGSPTLVLRESWDKNNKDDLSFAVVGIQVI